MLALADLLLDACLRTAALKSSKNLLGLICPKQNSHFDTDNAYYTIVLPCASMNFLAKLKQFTCQLALTRIPRKVS